MNPMTISNVFSEADNYLLDLAYDCKEILRVMQPGYFFRANVIAKIVDWSEAYTLAKLSELVDAGLVFEEEDSESIEESLYGTTLSDE